MSAKRSVVLLGAGASVEAGVPGAVGMIDRLFGRLAPPQNDLCSAALDYVRRSLERQRSKRTVFAIQGHFGLRSHRENDSVDIEQLMRSIDLLMQRDASDLSPFVLDWDEVATSVHASVFRDCRQMLEHLLVQELWIDNSNRVDYLKPLALRMKSDPSTYVATLNYDNCFELACDSVDLELVDCLDLVKSSRQGPRSMEKSLIKLHGSVDWALYEEHIGDQDAPTAPVASKIDSSKVISEKYVRRAMIFGNAAKLSAEKPFFDLFLLFYEELMRCDDLYIIGYSFRDPHINALIRRWLADRQGGVLRIADPAFGKGAVDDLPWQIKYLRDRRFELESSAGCAIAKWFP